VTSFVDLTEEEEGLVPYRGLLAEGVRHVRFAIRDFGCPSEADMTRILDTVDSELALGHVVYVHCRGGRGRTGTVVGCWLARHGPPGGDALARIAELRSGITDASWSSPETPEQRALVSGWPSGG
jgi:protein-tyrosine phosphatase